MHDILTVVIPLLAILFGTFWNQKALRDARAEIRDLKTDMNAQFRAVDTRLDRMQSDLSQFYRDLGRPWCAH